MKKFNLFLLPVILSVSFFSCSTDDSEPDDDSPFAMTAKINGELYQMQNPFGGNFATRSFFTYYPDSEYILLQGRKNIEINIWINRNDLAVGTYPVNQNTNETATHKDLIDNSNYGQNGVIYETTKSGHITITEINTSTKIIKGTFQFETFDSNSDELTTNFTITEGTFHYHYDVEY